MQGLQVWNDRVLLDVSRGGRLAFRLMPDGAFIEGLELGEGYVEVEHNEPVTGLLCYALPCVLESLVVRLEGVTAPLLSRTTGEWPPTVDDDQLEAYPHLHFLEERKTATPWRLERWYTLAGSYLVFDAQQYFERPCPRYRGKDWERLIVQLRQVVDLSTCSSNCTGVVANLLAHGT